MTFTTAPVLPIGPDMMGVAAEGTYFCVNNAQTGIATAATPTSFSDTNPFITIFNKNTAGGASIYLDFIALIATAAGTAGASVQCSGQLDFNVDRYTSGGTDLTSLIVNPNGNATGTSAAKFRAGNITASAHTSVSRTIFGNRYLSGAIPVAGDTYVLKFGGLDSVSTLGISTIKMGVQNVPKVVIPPQGSFTLGIWLPSQSAASSYAPEAGWVER